MKECKETITVFNSYLDEDGLDAYSPTVIDGVSWYSEVVSNVDSGGLIAANRYSIRIPVDADFSDKEYIGPEEYSKDTAESNFTLKQGDLIIHDIVTDTEDITPASLIERYGEVVTILGVTDNRKRPHGKHWKVTGK